MYIRGLNTFHNILPYDFYQMHVLLTCKIHSSLPNSPKCLNAFQHICSVKRLIYISSNLGFNETWGLIHPKGKIPLQLWNQTNDLLPKYNDRTGIGKKTFPFQKGETRKKRGMIDLKKVQNLTRQISLDFSGWRIIFGCMPWAVSPPHSQHFAVTFLLRH